MYKCNSCTKIIIALTRAICVCQKYWILITIHYFRQYIALAENGNDKDKKPSIGIYDLKTLELMKCLIIPFEDVSSREFVTIQFTCDSKYLAAITGEPDWMLYYYNWESGKIESHAKAQNPNGLGKISQVMIQSNECLFLYV